MFVICLKMAYSGYFILIPSFNKESSTDCFMRKQMLRTVFMTNYQNWQMHNFFFAGSQWTFKWIIDWKTVKWNAAWVNVTAILASAFQKLGSHWRYYMTEALTIICCLQEKNCSEVSAHCRGESGDVGACKTKLHQLQTSWRTSCKSESKYMKIYQTVQGCSVCFLPPQLLNIHNEEMIFDCTKKIKFN